MNDAERKELRKRIRPYVARPKEMALHSEEFEKWASHLIEIRIPSLFLEYGIDIYDTPGFLASDPPILAKNLLKLVSSITPVLVYLYDNPSVSDDARKCFEQLQLALRTTELSDPAIFFLNTKADALSIRKDAEDEDLGQDTNEIEDNELKAASLLQRERDRRFKLLLKATELSSATLHTKDSLPGEFNCFDIFSAQGSHEPLEKIMQKHAVKNIVRFASENDLKFTKHMINTILRMIDVFFDFILITNRRSMEYWDEAKNKAIKWIDEYFHNYESEIDCVIQEAAKRLPILFNQVKNEIEASALPHCKTNWWEQACISVSHDIIPLLPSNAGIEFVNMAVNNKVVSPVLNDIISRIDSSTKKKINSQAQFVGAEKNELLVAAYGEVMTINKTHTIFQSESTLQILKTAALMLISPLILVGAAVEIAIQKYIKMYKWAFVHKRRRRDDGILKFEQKQQKALHEYILDIQENIGTMDKKIKEDFCSLIVERHREVKEKICHYHRMATNSLDKRDEAYKLARKFAPAFAKFECSLIANLDLDNHRGLPPTIENKELGAGGFFTIHPATWGSESKLVVKKLRNATDQDIAYIEAHFYRTVTRLQIPHVVPLRYLYETVGNLHELLIVIPYYPKTLDSYLKGSIHILTIDKAVQISLTIATAVSFMHVHELVHRDIKAQNILMDENDQVSLADFGTCQHGTENSTFIGTRPFAPEITTGYHEYSYQGAAFDIFCLGVLMYVVAPKDSFHQPRKLQDIILNALDTTRVPKSYLGLIQSCINVDPKQRPTMDKIISTLDNISIEVANTKMCLICNDARRSIRCLPCGHKTMCSDCLKNRRQNSEEPQCIICREVFTDVSEDTNENTFMSNTQLAS